LNSTIANGVVLQISGNARTKYTRCRWICHFPVVRRSREF